MLQIAVAETRRPVSKTWSAGFKFQSTDAIAATFVHNIKVSEVLAL